MNVINLLNQELQRAKELLKVYESNPNGSSWQIFIKMIIRYAELSIQIANVPYMLESYEILKSLNNHG